MFTLGSLVRRYFRSGSLHRKQDKDPCFMQQRVWRGDSRLAMNRRGKKFKTSAKGKRKSWSRLMNGAGGWGGRQQN